MKKLMSHRNITNAIGAMILAAVVLSEPAGEARAAGGIERAAAPRSGRDTQYIVTDLGTLHGDSSGTAYALNEHGQIVGESDHHAFLWEDGVMIDLGALPGDSISDARDINNAGVVVGWSTEGGDDSAVAWIDGEIIDLNDEDEGRAYAINDQGTIVGWSRVDGDLHAFIGDVTGWQIDIGAHWPGCDSCATGINEEGVVVGWVEVGGGMGCGAYDAFMWDDGEITLLWQISEYEDAHYIPRDIAEDRFVVGQQKHGFYMDCNWYLSRPWRWDPGSAEGEFLPPLGDITSAEAINELGDIVGWSSIYGGEYDCAELWRGDEVHDLNGFIDPESGWHVKVAYDINNQGCIVGGADEPNKHPVLLAPIKPGDIDGDGDVDTADLLALLGAWGECEGCPEDIDGNGVVNTADLLILLGNWG